MSEQSDEEGVSPSGTEDLEAEIHRLEVRLEDLRDGIQKLLDDLTADGAITDGGIGPLFYVGAANVQRHVVERLAKLIGKEADYG
jgi:hypothetical protein